METLTRVLKYGTSDFFNFIRNIDTDIWMLKKNS